MKVFLGGTCNKSTWRAKLIDLLEIDYFNPVVEDWTPACQVEEIRQRALCDFCLYTITPLMTGVYSVAEVVDDSNKRPSQTIMCALNKDGNQEFTAGQWRSLMAVAKMVEGNGAKVVTSLASCADYLNRARS
jgi:hypothetical protein